MTLSEAITNEENLANASSWGSGNIEQEQYHRQIAEWLKALKEIWDSGDCNSCMFNGMCATEPKLGQMVRYNCYGYAKREVKADGD